MKKLVVILLSFLISSCNKDDNDSKVDKSIFLDSRKCLKIDDKEYEICLVSINDSRCPTDLICIWGGDAAVEFYLKSNTGNKSFTLHTHSNYQQDTVLNSLKIKLVDVLPYPKANNPIELSSYSVELRITEE